MDERGTRAAGETPSTINIVCPKCRRKATVPRQDHDPLNAVRAGVYCEKCVQGGYDNTSYYDAAGKEILGPPTCECCCEAEANLAHCHECGHRLCDDCVDAVNEEHGLSFCIECVEAGKVEITEESADAT